MSADEQMAVIGKLAVERVAAKREQALLDSGITDFASDLRSLSVLLPDAKNHAKVVSLIERLIALGGMDKLKAIVMDRERVSQRIVEVGQTLRNAGAE